MTLIPTSCWNSDKKMPTHTMGFSPSRSPLRLASPTSFSPLSEFLIASMRSRAFSRLISRSRTSRAVFSSPRATRKRGDSGMVSASTP